LALYCVVLGWDAVMPHIEAVSPRLALLSLTFAAVFLVQRSAARPWFDRNTFLALAVLNGVVAGLLPWPERLGFILVAGGCLLAALPVVGSVLGGSVLGGSVLGGGVLRGNVWRVPTVLGMWLMLMAAVTHGYRFLEAATHDLDWLARPVALAYRLLGIRAAQIRVAHFGGRSGKYRVAGIAHVGGGGGKGKVALRSASAKGVTLEIVRYEEVFEGRLAGGGASGTVSGLVCAAK
jgi:hypothetical protein